MAALPLKVFIKGGLGISLVPKLLHYMYGCRSLVKGGADITLSRVQGYAVVDLENIFILRFFEFWF